jgi:hypothetical protein
MPDDDGYPTDEELYAIAQWTGDLFHGGLHLWFDVIRSSWHWPDWGFKREGETYKIATGGWSGNESIIDAMMENTIAWNLTWQLSRRGGYFEFEVQSASSPTAPPATSP